MKQKKLIRLVVATLTGLVFSLSLHSQDTLHLYYKGLDTKLPDTSEAKIVQWAKNLNGKQVKVNVLAYYDMNDFKKVATERADEMFLILNRKARALVSIESYTSKKGKRSQRSLVDVIYYSPEDLAKAEKKKTEEKKEKPDAKDEKKLADSKKEGQLEKKTPAPQKPFVRNDEFKSRGLLVVLLSENKKEVESLTKKGKTDDLAGYRKAIEEYNSNVTKAFKEHWTSTPVEFKTEEEMLSMNLSEEVTKWSVLLPNKKQIEKLDFMTYKVALVYGNEKKKLINTSEFKITIPHGVPEISDLLVLMHKMKVFFGIEKTYDRNNLEELLGAKTLYVDTAMTELSEAEFKEGYPFPFKYTGSDEILKLANNRANNALYFKGDVYNNIVNVLVIDAENGAIVARTTIAGLAKVSMKTPEARVGNGSGLLLGGPQVSFEICTACFFSDRELFRLYTAKPRVKKIMLKYLIDEKKQSINFTPLIPY